MPARAASAYAIITATILAAVYTLVAGNQPLLGLDLQGGVSVVLQPTAAVDPETGEEVEIDDDALDQSVEIIRSRVDALGVAEPEISRQGETIVVDLPGVKEQQRALQLVGQTAELRFRPVLFDLGPELDLSIDPDAAGDADGEGDEDDASTADTDDADGETGDDGPDTATDDDAETTPEDTDTGDAGDETGEDGPDTTTDEGDGSSSTVEEESLPATGQIVPVAYAPVTPGAGPLGATGDDDAADTDATTADTEGDTGDADTEGDTGDTDGAGDGDTTGGDADGAPGTDDADGDAVTDDVVPQTTPDPAQLAVIEACGIPGVTPPEADLADSPVVLADETGNRLCLGPTLLTGDALETASATIDQTGQWVVNPTFKGGADGIDAFNQAAALCFVQAPDPNVCPSGRLAIVLDNQVVSAPQINSQAFGRDQIVISGRFDEDSARDLASVLRFGALPVELEPQQTRTVSATIGDDVLRSGVIAGLFGLVLVMIYLLFYYRLAGLVAIGGLVISAVLLWSIIAWFGENLGLALTLAGVVGLIVSVGVSADSNIVYFENVKDAYRNGRSVPVSVERAYQSAISTIIKADVVSLIAAVVLYLLTVGAVRGFAFYLGLATILDLVISLLFMRPALALLARMGSVERNPGLLGLPPSTTVGKKR